MIYHATLPPMLIDMFFLHYQEVFYLYLGGGFKYVFIFTPIWGRGRIPFLTNIFHRVETTNYCSYFLHSGKLWRATLYVLGRVGFQANQVLFLDFCVFSFVCSTVFPSLSLSCSLFLFKHHLDMVHFVLIGKIKEKHEVFR